MTGIDMFVSEKSVLELREIDADVVLCVDIDVDDSRMLRKIGALSSAGESA